MKRRIFAALLAGAMVLSLAACGGKNGGGASSSNPGSSSSANGSGAGSSQPDGSPVVTPDPEVTLNLNKTEVTLNKAGATFQLRYTTDPEIDAAPIYLSSDEKIATVDDMGTITAVAPGKTTVTLECGGAIAVIDVTCDWQEEVKPDPKPEPKPEPKPDGGGSSSGSGSSSSTPAANVDLSSFYSTITGKYEFGFLELADKDILDMLYPSISGVDTQQCLVYYCMMSMNNGEFGLVQVKDSKDVDAVKAAFQARIDYMVGDGNGPGGAQYPMAMDQWENNSRVVSNGNYVMMVVHESCDDIVNEFNALF